MFRRDLQGTATQFIVDGKPFVALTGEIEGADATSLDNTLEPAGHTGPVVANW
jgi:hypothetical protein